MNLESLQTNLSALIKSRRTDTRIADDYVALIESSDNLKLIKKIAVWWRKIQVEQYCVLTGNLLKLTGDFDSQLSTFMSAQSFSSFRDEVGNQFLDYIIAKYPHSLIRSVAGFESAIIKLKLGENMEAVIKWDYEPYAVIGGLLNNRLQAEDLIEGEYEVHISSKHKDALFTVTHH